ALGPKTPLAFVVASCSSVVSKYRSTRSEAPKPLPDTLTVVVGGPLAADRMSPGTTVKTAALVAVPPDVVTVMNPVEPLRGTVALSLILEKKVHAAGIDPLNRTVEPVQALPDPAKPDPSTST